MRGKILLDSDILRSQIRSLSDHSSTMSAASARAQVSMPTQAFGHLNFYLATPCNSLAGTASDLLSTVSDMFDALERGVQGVLDSFASIEEDASAVIDRLEP